MNIHPSLKSDCQVYRVQFNETVPQESKLRAHENSCQSCRLWSQQTANIMQLAKTLPQFDVPQALTQRIMQSVDTASSSMIGIENIFLLPLSLISAAIFITATPVDSLEGIISWCLGIFGLLLLKLLLSDSQPQKQST